VRAAFRAAHGIGPTENVALFTGHNFRLKGLGPLLKAMADRLKRSDAIPLRLLVCGGGDPAPFRTLAQRLGIEQHVTFLGRVPDVRACFHASDLFVLPTYYDPCSLVVFEALACGLPVVTTRCNGAGELLSQGVEGFVIDSPDDQPGLIAALDALSNAQFRGRAAVAAARLGREQSFDRHVDRLLEVAAQSAAQKRSFKRRRHASAARNTSFASTHTES
jgi:UDP-glucose:(heptosyl)LPS alpha-1,3-glucosyltransferase